MRAYVLIFLLVCASGFVISCGGDENSTEEPVFELAVGEEEGTEADNSGTASYEVDLEIMKEAVDSEPGNPDANFIYMTGLLRAGEYFDTLEQCRILAELEGENPYLTVAYLNFGTVVLDHIPRDAPDREALLTEAIDYLWIGLGMEPESIPAHRLLGLLAMESGDHERALHHLAIALSATEIGYTARADMAAVYIEREDFKKAREHLDIAFGLATEADDRAAVGRIRNLQGKLQ